MVLLTPPPATATWLPSLAQQPRGAAGSMAGIAFWTLLIAAAVAVLVFVALMVRKRYLAEDPPEERGEGFTLDELRQMHHSGQLTDVEYDSAKAAVIRESQARLHANPPAAVSHPGQTPPAMDAAGEDEDQVEPDDSDAREDRPDRRDEPIDRRETP